MIIVAKNEPLPTQPLFCSSGSPNEHRKDLLITKTPVRRPTLPHPTSSYPIPSDLSVGPVIIRDRVTESDTGTQCTLKSLDNKIYRGKGISTFMRPSSLSPFYLDRRILTFVYLLPLLVKVRHDTSRLPNRTRPDPKQRKLLTSS